MKRIIGINIPIGKLARRAALHCHPYKAGYWLFFLIAVVSGSFALVGCHHRSEQANVKGDETAKEGDSAEGAVVTARVANVQRRPISEAVFALGTCEALLDKSAVLTPAVEGQVSEILVKHGEKVKAGQPIVRLNAKLAEANLQEKISTVAGLKASLKLLQTLPRPEEQKSYQLAIDDAKVALQKAKAVAERLRPLRERGDIPEQQLSEAELTVEQSRLALEKAESQYKAAMLGPRPEAVDEAQSHIATAEAGVAVAQRQLDLLTLRSPIDGVIDRIACKLGQTLAVGALVAEVVEVKQLEVLAWLPAFEAARVHLGQSAEIRSGGASESKENLSNAAIPGKVTFVGGVVDPQTGSLPIRILIENSADHFALGQTVAAAIAVREKPDVLAVPTAALDDLGDGPRLNVVRDGKSVVLHPRLGIKNKEWVEIEGTDLKAGEAVVVEGGYNLPEGTKVAPASAAADGKSSAERPNSAAAATGADR
jgi:multidrug efflux pump subunit AcrA (membrane-fusion protein)